MKNKLCLVAMLVAAIAFADDSTTVNWVTTAVSGTSQWGTPSNWSPECVPTNGENVVFPDLTAAPYVKRVSTGITPIKKVGGEAKPDADGAIQVSIGTLTGSSAWTIRTAEETSGNQAQVRRLFSVDNPNGFDGFWDSGDGKAVLRLNATASFTPKMAHVSAVKRPEVQIPTAGTTAEVTTVSKAGAFVKSGAGTLAVRSLANADLNAYVNEGELVFCKDRSQSSVDVAALIAEAALDLDASVVSSTSDRLSPSRSRTVRLAAISPCRPWCRLGSWWRSSTRRAGFSTARSFRAAATTTSWARLTPAFSAATRAPKRCAMAKSG